MKPTAFILTIGDELLKGSTLNTNARFLGEELTRLGFRVLAQASCPDDRMAIARKLSEALSSADMCITCGGLGPTPDDVTREGIADFFKVPLEYSASQYRQIQRYFRSRKKKIPAIVKREAMFPANAKPLINKHGVALGFYVICGHRLVAVLPGVPSEMEKMFRGLVAPLAKRHFKSAKRAGKLTIKVAGLSEPEIMQKLGKGFFRLPFDFGIYPSPCETTIRIQAETRQILSKLKTKAVKSLGKWVFAWDETSLAAAVGKKLKKNKQTLSAAESCTGGRLSAELTSVPGASRYFKGGMTAYSNQIKSDCLDVDTTVLRRSGAVSEEVAGELAKGVRLRMKTTWGVGITGIAGPAGGSRQKPVGTVFIAIAGSRKYKVRKYQFWGDRSQVQLKAAKKALDLLWRELK